MEHGTQRKITSAAIAMSCLLGRATTLNMDLTVIVARPAVE